MKSEIEKIEKQTVRHWFEDGIYEMAIGAFQIVGGIFCWLYSKIPADLAWRAAWFLCAYPLVIVCGRLFMKRIKPFKEKFTFPRTGFVSYNRPRKRKLGFSIPGLISGLVGALAFSLGRGILEPTGIRALPTMAGLFAGGISIWLIVKTGLPRYFATAILCALAAAWLSHSPLAEMAALGAFWTILGAGQILLGGLSFLRFLRRNPVRAADLS